MRRLLVAAALVAGAFASAPAASACTVETCVPQSVCTKVPCHICYYEPPGVERCII